MTRRTRVLLRAAARRHPDLLPALVDAIEGKGKPDAFVEANHEKVKTPARPKLSHGRAHRI